MKITRIVSTIIVFSTMILPFQLGQIQTLNRPADYNVSNHFGNYNLSLKTNRLPGTNITNSPALGILSQTSSCHFGITVPEGLVGYNLSSLGVDSYLDWGRARTGSVAANIQYYPVLNVNDSSYQSILQALPSLLTAKSGLTWIIGNEPDSEVSYQDHISAESYADRYYELATIIRNIDPSAKIAFGTVIQPTPVRMYYLNRAIDQLTVKVGGDRAKALGLIDIYSIHAFILNEQPIYNKDGQTISWGAGVPIGYDSNWPAFEIITGAQTHDINLFTSRVIGFRQWMKGLGEQSKPLWITEYGSLFPTWLDVSEQTTATFMDQTFDFMLGTKDPTLGYIDDGNRLVQKWMWYSLNGDVNKFGGSLYNPLNHQLTTIGDHFIKYDPSITSVPVTNPDVYIDSSSPTITPGSNGAQPKQLNYKITVKVGNKVSSDRLTDVKVDLYLAGAYYASVLTNLPRCAGEIPVTFNLNNLQAGVSYNFTALVSQISGNVTDIDPSNNVLVFPPITMPILYFSILPIVSR